MVYNGTSGKDAPKTKIRRNIKSFQRSNKRMIRRYGYESEKMKRLSEMVAEKREGVTIFEGFTGTRKGDLKKRKNKGCGFDETLLGTNKRFENPELREEGEGK